MESKLLKVKLKADSKNKFLKLLEYMKSNPEEPLSEMKQKGYFWDSFFLDKENNLFMVLKSKDFSKIMLDDSELIATNFRAVYEQFRQDCWIPESYEDIEELICFNNAYSFMNRAT